MSFHKFHLERSEGESWEQYEERLLSVMQEASGSSAYKAILDFIEAFVRKQYEIAMTCRVEDVEDKRIAAKVGLRIYTSLSKLQSLETDPTEQEISAFSGRAPDMSVHSQSRFAAARRAKASAVARAARGR